MREVSSRHKSTRICACCALPFPFSFQVTPVSVSLSRDFLEEAAPEVDSDADNCTNNRSHGHGRSSNSNANNNDEGASDNSEIQIKEENVSEFEEDDQDQLEPTETDDQDEEDPEPDSDRRRVGIGIIGNEESALESQTDGQEEEQRERNRIIQLADSSVKNTDQNLTPESNLDSSHPQSVEDASNKLNLTESQQRENSSTLDEPSFDQQNTGKVLRSNLSNSSSKGNYKKPKRIAEKLALIFEYPCFLREEVSSFTKEKEDFIFCSKCQSKLNKLHAAFQEFTDLISREGRVLRTLQKITTADNSVPILPMLVYGDDEGNDDSQNVSTGSGPGFRSNNHQSGFENPQFPPSVLLNHLKNALKHCTAEEMEDYRQLFMTQNQKRKQTTRSTLNSAKRRRKLNKITAASRRTKSASASVATAKKIKKAKNSARAKTYMMVDENEDYAEDIKENFDEAEIMESDEPDGEDDMGADPTFRPRDEFKKSHAETKKRRGRKPGWRKPKQKSASEDPVDESQSEHPGETTKAVTASNPAGASRPKRKRVRCLKKELWYDKAKDDPNRICDICGKVFLYTRMMKHHRTTVHEGKKPFECEFCGRGFTQKFILKKHTCDYSLAGGDREYLKIAREEMLFKWSCDVCGKRFKERSALAVHQKNHTGESYKCDRCDKTFRRPDHLKTHVRIVHSDEKRFVCTTCGQRFKTSSNLRAHERKHANPDQKHLCNICGKSIKTLSQMGRHQKTHEDVLPFECNICGKRFKMKDYLGQHLRKGKACSSRSYREEQLKVFEANSNSEEIQGENYQQDQHQPSTSFTINDPNQNSNFHQVSNLPSSFSSQHSIFNPYNPL